MPMPSHSSVAMVSDDRRNAARCAEHGQSATVDACERDEGKGGPECRRHPGHLVLAQGAERDACGGERRMPEAAALREAEQRVRREQGGAQGLGVREHPERQVQDDRATWRRARSLRASSRGRAAACAGSGVGAGRWRASKARLSTSIAMKPVGRGAGHLHDALHDQGMQDPSLREMSDAGGLNLAADDVAGVHVGACVEVGRLVPVMPAVRGDPEARHQGDEEERDERAAGCGHRADVPVLRHIFRNIGSRTGAAGQPAALDWRAWG